MNVIEGDCLDLMRLLIEEGLQVQSVVCDPPYGLSFMGRYWDAKDNVAFQSETWRLCYDLLVPGGHLIAFGGTKTYHRLACAVEDADFEIRDQLAWVYGSGMPKSLNISKAMDKAAGAELEGIGYDATRARPNRKYHENISDRSDNGATITAPATDAAKEWEGWGTALKPAWEPIVLARKPFTGTVVQNVLEHGAGGLHIDACRIETDPTIDDPRLGGKAAKNVYEGGYAGVDIASSRLGRWPANLIHDGSDEVTELFPLSKGQQGDIRGTEPSRPAGQEVYGTFERMEFKKRDEEIGSAARFFYSTRDGEVSKDRRYTENGGTNFAMKPGERRSDSGPISRFFYCAKAGKKERNGSKHPTIKPLALMRWLVRLVTPSGGLVLDPFAGTGTTGEAAVLEGFDYLLIERDPESISDIERRLTRNEGINTRQMRDSPDGNYPEHFSHDCL